MIGNQLSLATLTSVLSAGQDTALEQGGLRRVLELLANGPLVTEAIITAGPALAGQDREHLQPGDHDTACTRTEVLRTAGGILAGQLTAVLLPRRVPAPARQALGVHRSGSPFPRYRSSFPLEEVLRGAGIRRRQLSARLPGPDGELLVSVALLLAPAGPLAVVTERVCVGFPGIPEQPSAPGRPAGSAR